jgi:DNA-binding CsgD family transcriptional regulator
MDRDRCTAMSYFLRFLCGSPDGDAVCRAMVLGALTPLNVTLGQIYASTGNDTLELIANYGFTDEEASAYRALPIGLPLPVCDAFRTMNTLTLNTDALPTTYPMLANEPSLTEGTLSVLGDGRLVCVPVIYSGVPIGVIALIQTLPHEADTTDWQYIDGIASAVGMWMNNERQILIDRWRRAAPPAPREVRITDRQRQILELISNDRTNSEIARELGYSVPTIKKDLQHIMRILGTMDRRATAGRAREIGLLPERRARD